MAALDGNDMTTAPLTDPTQPITASDPRVAQILAMIQAKAAQSQPAPVPPDPSTATIAPVPTPQYQTPPLPSPIQQAAQLPPQPTPPDAPNLPPMQSGPPQVQAPPAPNVTPQAGPVKSFLQSLVSNLGGAAYQGSQGALQRLGIPTDYEKQQTAAKLAISQQQANDMSAYRQAQTGGLQAKADQLDFLNQSKDIAPDDASVLPQFRGLQGTTVGAYQTLQKISAQTKGKTDVAEITLGAPVTLSPALAQRAGMPQLAGQQVNGKTLSNIQKLISAGGSNIIQGDIGNGHTGLIDKDTGQVLQDFGTSQKIIGANINAADRTVQVPDPTNPNQTIQVAPSVANARGMAGLQSIPFQTNKVVTRYFTVGDGAKSLNSFNTTTDHLKQLGVAAGALGNGDMQLFNKWGQAYAQQTGSAAPTNFDAVKTAVAGEIGKVFKGGNATDSEIAELNATINRAQSPQQLQGVIQTYTDLMNSKRNALQQQYVQGKQGNPNFPTAPAASTKADYVFIPGKGLVKQ